MDGTLIAIIFLIFAVVLVVKTVRIVPQQTAFVVERLGKYSRTLDAGLHIVYPFIDAVRFRHSLKEYVLDIPAQVCITKDNVSVHIDGIVFFRVVDPVKATYGINDYVQAIVQLAQTTLRSEIGKIDLDRTFEERDKINNAVISAVETATHPWGVKVMRYEIKSITPPKDIIDAMEKQMRAEREKRAKILESKGDRDSKINRADGGKQEIIKNSEAQKTRQINEAEGQAAAIASIAEATSSGLRKIADALNAPGGDAAARLKIAEEYVRQMGSIAKDAKAIVIPANMSEPAQMIASAFTVFDQLKK